MNTPVFSKRTATLDMARYEVASLLWLGEHAPGFVAVPCDPHTGEAVTVLPTAPTVATVQATPVRPTPAAAFAAGEALAALHQNPAPAFGAPPSYGGKPYAGETYIGRLAQPCEPTDHWAEFYTAQRVLHPARLARDAGTLLPEEFALLEEACAALLDCAEPWAHRDPVLVHGDLWTGNLLFTTTGPLLIDPAAHGGHPEVDIAMLALFGVPYWEEIVAGYSRVAGDCSAALERLCIHQLHPLAVHTLTHGRSYASSLVQAARATLAYVQ
ncbi:fructosamine kinase family protein [Corynebacterium choanae]|uniref:Fructosamine kinase n=1 Tax=Corynebacterium choanae TaxID=1862358 RepID=A0A3G6J461_9CORY|nr:fructosamine kinase family protein [Corynebacterium choanae]AZA12865.1 Fructosamine kinase [Corynebacterium choanae]